MLCSCGKCHTPLWKLFQVKTFFFTISHPTNDPINPYVTVLYQTLKPIFKNARVLRHGSTVKRNLKISYLNIKRNSRESKKNELNLERHSKKSIMRLIMNLVVYFILRHKEQNYETLIKYTGRVEMLKTKRSLIQVIMLLMTL